MQRERRESGLLQSRSVRGMVLQSVVTFMYERLGHHFYTVCSVIYMSIVLIINDIKRINNKSTFEWMILWSSEGVNCY